MVFFRLPKGQQPHNHQTDAESGKLHLAGKIKIARLHFGTLAASGKKRMIAARPQNAITVVIAASNERKIKIARMIVLLSGISNPTVFEIRTLPKEMLDAN